MLQTEFIRSLQSNYERILLQQKPDEKRYQYCILTRGGIRGLLSCSLRYINGQVYLYYDITSRQNVAQLYSKQTLSREWVRDFFWSYAQIRQELGRFLLDEKNILVYPEQIFQDLGNRNFFFLYLPYNEEETGFMQFFDFLIERLDYEDDLLVECVYKMYEQYEKNKELYLQEKVFEDVAILGADVSDAAAAKPEKPEKSEKAEQPTMPDPEIEPTVYEEPEPSEKESSRQEKKGLFSLWGNKKKRNQELRAGYYESMSEAMAGRAVAEDTMYEDYEEEEYGKTVFVAAVPAPVVRKLFTPDGRVAAMLDKDVFTIGKHRGEVDLVLEEESVSRLHARIFAEDKIWYLEDLNSTNGTFKNGLQLQPYEKRRLEEGDEIQIGKLLFIYR